MSDRVRDMALYMCVFVQDIKYPNCDNSKWKISDTIWFFCIQIGTEFQIFIPWVRIECLILKQVTLLNKWNPYDYIDYQNSWATARWWSYSYSYLCGNYHYLTYTSSICIHSICSLIPQITLRYWTCETNVLVNILIPEFILQIEDYWKSFNNILDCHGETALRIVWMWSCGFCMAVWDFARISLN